MSVPDSATGAPLDVAASGQNGERGNWWTRSGLVARIAVSAFVVGVGLALVFAVLFVAIGGLRNRSLEARHSQQVIAKAYEVETLVIDLETGLRGFFITKREEDLRPWRTAQRRYPAAITDLFALTRDNADQYRRAREIKQVLQNQLVCFSLQQTLAKFTQNGCVKARVGELKTEHIFPIQAPTNGIGCLLIRKPLGKLHEANQQQTPWRFC